MTLNMLFQLESEYVRFLNLVCPYYTLILTGPALEVFTVLTTCISIN